MNNILQDVPVKKVDDNNAAVEVDFSEAIASQVEALQGGSSASGERRFQAVDTKMSRCIFVKTTLDRPDELVAKLVDDVLETGRTKARHVQKIFPVLGTCRAVADKIEKLVEDSVSSYFADWPLKSFAIVFKVRCNNLSRSVLLPAVGRAVQRACPTSKVDLDNPDYTISIDILTKFACVSVMKDFGRLRKYNLQELAKSGGDRTTEKPASEQNNAVSSEQGTDVTSDLTSDRKTTEVEGEQSSCPTADCN